jgi:DNA-directed RNA polymerase sigma subunit (sigma70/sigma32)
MNAERFIRLNPFPNDGADQSLRLVMDIQNPTLDHLKQENIERLFKLNARLIWIVYRQYNYGESLDSVMSFMYEGIRKASETFDASRGVPFYIYAMMVTRSLLQSYQAYHGAVIHIPLKQRGDYDYAYSDINEYIDLEKNNPHELTFNESAELDDIDEIYELVEKYSVTPNISDRTEYGLRIIHMMKTKSMHEICTELDISDDKYRDVIKMTIHKLKQYRKYGTCQHLTK